MVSGQSEMVDLGSEQKFTQSMVSFNVVVKNITPISMVSIVPRVSANTINETSTCKYNER